MSDRDKRVVYRDGTYKDVLREHAWEYEKDPDYCRTEDVPALNAEEPTERYNASARSVRVAVVKFRQQLRQDNSDLQEVLRDTYYDGYSAGYDAGRAWRRVDGGNWPTERTPCWVTYWYEGDWYVSLFIFDPTDILNNKFPVNTKAFMPLTEPQPYTEEGQP